MTTQYNVVTYGNLTNNNGVLSGFSLNDYATLSKTLQGLTIDDLEIVFKFKIADNSSDNMILWTDSVSEPVVGGLRLYSNNTSYSYGLEVTHNGGQVGYIESEGNLLSLDTYYFIKAIYSNSSGYGLYRSEDGIAYTLIGTIPNTTMPSNPLGLIGIGGWNSYFHGSIDLNESYIKVNGAIWWRGAENITKIQLRHDTAANWTSVNPILLEGEVGIETDTRKQKFGDGSTAWNSLPYDKGSTALQSITSSDVTNALGYTPVNKSGDTMSGKLTVDYTSANDDSPIVVKSTNLDFDTAPNSNVYPPIIQFCDQNNNKMGQIEYSKRADGGHYIAIVDRENSLSSDYATIKTGWDGNGTAYTSAPACEVNNGIVTTVSKSKAQNGYYKLGNGLIIQWGTVAATTGTTGQVTLPTAFTASNYQIAYGSSTNLSIGTTSQTTTNFDWKKASTNASINWIAIGY